MDMNRRKFLKLGTAAVAGLGVAAATANPAVAAAVICFLPVDQFEAGQLVAPDVSLQ